MAENTISVDLVNWNSKSIKESRFKIFRHILTQQTGKAPLTQVYEKTYEKNFNVIICYTLKNAFV